MTPDQARRLLLETMLELAENAESDGSLSEEAQDQIEHLTALANDETALAEFARRVPSTVRLSLQPDRSPRESSSSEVDRLIDLARRQGLRVTEKVRKEITAAVKKKSDPR